MASIEKKVINAILARIRKRRRVFTATRDGEPEIQPLGALASVKLREAQLSDFDAVAELKRRWGLKPDSFENWERLWGRNPVLDQTQAERPIGWVLESADGVVGYLGNISLRYHYGGKTLTVVTSTGLVVAPAYRAVSLSLVAAYYRQKSVDLYLATTVIEAVGKIARAFKSEPLPQRDYDTVLFWVLRPRAFAQAVMQRLDLGAPISHLAGIFAAILIGTNKIVRKRWPRKDATPFVLSEIAVSEIGADFQALWERKLQEGGALLADRSAAVLRWHFEIPGDRGTTRVLCCRENGELAGYAVIRNDRNSTNGLRRSSIGDMLVKGDNPAIFRALLIAAHDYAKRQGNDVLELLGFPHIVRRICAEWNPYLRKYPACPFYYKAADPTLHKALSYETAWYAGPFDGDTTLMP
jgi:hypothetical protein